MKKIIKENYRVVIEPNYALYYRGEEREEDARRTCESIIDDIKRHVDELSSVELDYDEKEICEFCLREWEVEEKDDAYLKIFIGQPVCCQEAIDEFLKERDKDEKMLH